MKAALIAGLEYVESILRNLHTDSETRSLTPEEWTAVDEGLAYVEATRSEIARYDALEAAANSTAARSGDGARDFQFQKRVDTDRADIRYLSSGELRDKALAVIERAAADAGLSAAAQRQIEHLARRSDGEVARRVLVTENDAYRSAFMKYATGSPAYTAEEARALEEYRALNITTTTAGGFGVPVVIDPSIILTDQESGNPFFQIANVQRITTKDWKGVSAAGVTWAFETESAAANDLTPTLAQPTVYAHKAQGFLPFTIEVGMDYPEFAAEMARLLGAGYDELLLDKFTTGSGTGMPWGIFEACENATCQVTVNTDAGLYAADINKVFTALPQKYRSNASWLMHIDVNQDIQALGDDKLATQTVNLAAGAIDTLKNRPVYESAYAPQFSGTTGQASILVIGDFRNFVIAQRAGMEIEYVPHVFDTTTGTPIGQRGWYAWTRVGSDSVNDNAFRMLVNT